MKISSCVFHMFSSNDSVVVNVAFGVGGVKIAHSSSTSSSNDGSR